MRNFFILLLIVLLSFPLFLNAQVSYFEQNDRKSNYFIDKLKIDLPKSKRSIRNTERPYQFAIPFNANRSIHLGDEDKSVDGYFHYFLEIKAVDAYALNFTLEGLKGADVVAVFIQIPDEAIAGPYLHTGNSVDLSPFPNFFTDELTIEIISKQMLKENQVRLFRIGIVYDKGLLGHSEDCEVDINCDQGQDWQDVKRSVVRIVINNAYLCTGTILNNTLDDKRPFLLTANHCIDNPQSAANSVFSFNYDAPFCNALSMDYPSVTFNRIFGSELKATKYDAEGKLDFTLLELDDPVPEEYNAHFSGWSASSQEPAFVACVHHPGGDVKKISIDFDKLVVGNFSNEFDENSFWRVLKWDVGATEGGSSGSAIFNDLKQVVGSLTGGEASCDYPYNDYFVRFDLAFDKYSDSSQQLKYWLDPAGLNVRSWYGYPKDVVNDSLNVYLFPNPAHERIQVYSPTLMGKVKILIYDMNGVLIWEEIVDAENQMVFFNVPANTSGMHYVRLETQSEVIKKKIVIY